MPRTFESSERFILNRLRAGRDLYLNTILKHHAWAKTKQSDSTFKDTAFKPILVGIYKNNHVCNQASCIITKIRVIAFGFRKHASLAKAVQHLNSHQWSINSIWKRMGPLQLASFSHSFFAIIVIIVSSTRVIPVWGRNNEPSANCNLMMRKEYEERHSNSVGMGTRVPNGTY